MVDTLNMYCLEKSHTDTAARVLCEPCFLLLEISVLHHAAMDSSRLTAYYRQRRAFPSQALIAGFKDGMLIAAVDSKQPAMVKEIGKCVRESGVHSSEVNGSPNPCGYLLFCVYFHNGIRGRDGMVHRVLLLCPGWERGHIPSGHYVPSPVSSARAC